MQAAQVDVRAFASALLLARDFDVSLRARVSRRRFDASELRDVWHNRDIPVRQTPFSGLHMAGGGELFQKGVGQIS